MRFGSRIAIVWVVVASLAAVPPVFALNILLLNSYQKGDAWTDAQSDRIEAELRRARPGANIDVFYMDSRRFSSDENLEDVRRTLQHRHAAA